MRNKNIENPYTKYGKEPLKDYFKIENLEPYKDIFIVNLNFSNRVQNQLKENDCTTIADLLNCSLPQVKNFKHLGKNSIDNILSVLEQFLIDNGETAFTGEENFSMSEDEVEAELQKAIEKNSPYIDLLQELKENFSKTLAKKYRTLKILDEKINGLPEEYLENNISELIYHYTKLGEEELIDNVPGSLKISKFTSFLKNHSEEFDWNILENFALWLDFDIKSIAEFLLAPVYEKRSEKDRTETVVFARIEGQTLEEIGEHFKITRERVRQIENKLVKRIEECLNQDRYKTLLMIQFFKGGKSSLYFDDLEYFLGEKTATIMWFFLSKIQPKDNFYTHDTYKNVLNFQKKNFEIDVDEKKIFNDLPAMIAEETFDDDIKNLALKYHYPLNLFTQKTMKIFTHSGKFYVKNNVPQWQKYNYVLKMWFKDGFKTANKEYYEKFGEGFKYYFGGEFKSTMRALDATIMSIGFLCDRGTYLHRDYVKIPVAIMNEINNYIVASPRNTFPFKELYKIFEDKLADTQIKNTYLLQGALKLSNLPYIFRRDYLTKNLDINVSEEFTKFIAEHGRVTKQEIKNEFVAFSDINIALIIPRCPEVISIGNGEFIHSSILKLYDEDYSNIENLIREKYESVPITSKYIYRLVSEKFPDFIARNDITTHDQLFGILKYMFDSKFYFSRPYISVDGEKNLTHKKVLTQHFENEERLNLHDVVNFCREQGINFISQIVITENLRPYFVRIDVSTLVNTKTLNLTDEVISKTVEVVRMSMEKNNGWRSIQTFKDYDQLPDIGLEWTPFLLDSVIALSEDSISTVKVFSSSNEFVPTIFLSKKFEDDSYETFLLKILRTRQKKKKFLNNEDLLGWLKRNGLCHMSIPNFLIQEDRLKYDSKNNCLIIV